MDERHRRIRARSATGQVAGAATEKASSKLIVRINGLSILRSPRKPPSQSAERKVGPGRSAFGREFHAPRSGTLFACKRARSMTRSSAAVEQALESRRVLIRGAIKESQRFVSLSLRPIVEDPTEARERVTNLLSS